MLLSTTNVSSKLLLIIFPRNPKELMHAHQFLTQKNVFYLGQNHEYIVSVRAFNNFGESEPVIAVATAGNEHCKLTLIRGLLISPKKRKENARAELT